MNLLRRLDRWIFALLVLLAAGVLGFFSARYVWHGDWTYGARASMSPQTRAVLQQLKGPVQITSYAAPQGDLRQTISAVLSRYQLAKPNLSLSFVDPQQDPAAMRQLGITVDGELILRYQGHEQRLDTLNERSLTDALQRLLRGNDRIVAFVTGDGERLADGRGNSDMGMFIGQLEQSGMRAVPLNFSQTSSVPQQTDLVVLASPQSALGEGAIKALLDYVNGGGNLLWLTDPGPSDPGLDQLSDTLGLRVLPGELVDPTTAGLGLKDPRMILLGAYPPNPITRGFTLGSLFPEVAPLAQTRVGEWQVQPLLRSSAQATTQPISGTLSNALKGPLDFGFALNRLSPSPAHSEQRIVVIGDGDFLSNSFLGNVGNRALGERVFDWLLGDDALINLPPRGAPDRVITLGQHTLDLLGLLYMVVLPLLLLIVAGLIAWRRRRA